MKSKLVDALLRRVVQYEGFERIRTDLLNQRNGASSSEKVMIAERLERNDRMLQSMQQNLETAKNEIRRLRRKD